MERKGNKESGGVSVWAVEDDKWSLSYGHEVRGVQLKLVGKPCLHLCLDFSAVD